MVKITDNTPAVLEEVDTRIAAGLAEIGSAVERDAKVFVHVRTGKLQRSIRQVMEARAVHIGSDVEYAADLELGGPHRAAYPYLVPSLEGNREKLRRIFKAK